MANLKGVNIPSTIVPFNTEDTYPTHLAEYGKGGYRSCQTIADRDKIPAARREQGMLVYVVSEDVLYKLESNNQWSIYINKGGSAKVGWKTINDDGEIEDL